LLVRPAPTPAQSGHLRIERSSNLMTVLKFWGWSAAVHLTMTRRRPDAPSDAVEMHVSASAVQRNWR
jgi:hypothetical protein